MDAVILQRPDHFQPGSIAHVRQARIAVSAEVALQNAPVFGAVEQRAPGFQLAHARRGFLGMQLGHARVVQILAAAHSVGEVHAPTIAIVDISHGSRHAAFGHHCVGLPE